MSHTDVAVAIELAKSHWTLSKFEPIADTPTSWVYKVMTRSGAPAALKIVKPYGMDEIRGGALMAWYGGLGAAAILQHENGMMLMEWCEHSPLGGMVRAGNDTAATSILCEVIGQLHHPRKAPPPQDLVPLRQWFSTLFEADPAIWPASHRALAARAIRLAATLFEDAAPVIPLHGDLHHDNVVGSHRGWLAIDPKGLVGDPCYETSNLFRNPEGAEELAATPTRVDALADMVSVRLGLKRKRVLSWAAVHSAVSTCWDHKAGNSIGWDLRMLPLLLDAVDRS